MTTIVTKKGSQSYAVYVDGRKIAECAIPETSSNELVKNLGIDISEVQVVEMDSFPAIIGTGHLVGSIVQEIVKDTITEKSSNDIDDVINTVNAGMSAKNIGKYNRHEIVDEYEDTELENEDEIDNTKPVGNIKIPALGNLVYVDGFDGFLRKITGGIGTVHLVFDEETKQEVKHGDEPESILVELEEVPGVYFTWNSEQEQLKEKYGYKPVCSLK